MRELIEELWPELVHKLAPKGGALMPPKSEWPHAIREAATAIIIPWDDELGVSYTYANGDAEAGPIGSADWPAIRALERNGKLSFASKKIRDRFLKLRALGPDH
jgi:hypothetical protein